MDALAFVDTTAQTGVTNKTTGKQILEKAQTVGAIVGMTGGIAAAISGALLMVAGWLSANDGARHWLSTAGSALLCLTIPLIILAAFCLDWMEKEKPRQQSKVSPYDDDEL